MLWELSVVEQRYHAVMEVLVARVAIIHVAQRYDVHRNSVASWVRRYEEGGFAALADRSHRPHHQPRQIDSEVEAVICELRREHPRWGPMRLGYELERKGMDEVPSRSTIYRVLVRHHLVAARSRKKRRDEYVRWERDEPMELWQLDIMGSLWLIDGTELKLVTGLDDCSRYCVIAKVVARATGRRVCAAFAAALETYGIPEEVLTDNGKQFTGRFGKPRPGETLFERICRENGITALHTGVRSPTTTGKVERFHETLQYELLAGKGPFADLDAAQAAVDAAVYEYNHRRPHQSLDMATPASRFKAVPEPERLAMPLRLPPNLVVAPPPSVQSLNAHVVEDPALTADHVPDTQAAIDPNAIEIDRTVPPSGNLKVARQQFWFGPRLAGQEITLWIDTKTVHVTMSGRRLKTVPSRLSEPDLARLRRDGGRQAGPPPAPPSVQMLARGVAVEVDRMVNAIGLVSVGGIRLGVGQPLAGQLVTLRIEDDLIHVVADGKLWRTISSPLPRERLHHLRGARLAGQPPMVDPEPIRIERRVSVRGAIRVNTQRIQVGIVHARKVVTVALGDTTLRVIDSDTGEILKTVPRTSTKEVLQYKAHGYDSRTKG